jgi:hypothetical protein
MMTLSSPCASLIVELAQVAVHLFNLNNFNGLMEIIAGLNFSSVKRLAPAWAKVSSKDRKVFEKLASRMTIHNNYKAYRQLYQKRAAPKLPYFAVILRDLMFVQVWHVVSKGSTPRTRVHARNALMLGDYQRE